MVLITVNNSSVWVHCNGITCYLKPWFLDCHVFRFLVCLSSIFYMFPQRVVHKEKQRWTHAKSARKKLLNECRVLRDRLQECSVNFLSESEDRFTINPSSLSDALDLLATSDNRIGLLLAEVTL